MKQLIQNLKDGKMELMEVPEPSVNGGYILVRNHYSVISAGTEGKTVKDARMGYLGKAKARQKEVKQVIDMAFNQGIKQTYNVVMNKLESPSTLGYSSAGEVIEVGAEVKNFSVGDLVACGGSAANHSEIVAVPKNLAVKVPLGTNMKYAALTTVASIAMQGVRQADLRLGENCVVVGLGLIGQLTIQVLNAGGILPIGIDIDEKQVELAKKCGCTNSFNRNTGGLEETIVNLTGGHGTDAVIITAASSSDDPVNFAGSICRKKGKVVIVGAVPTGFDRKDYYRKELDLRMSSSYGPGRYDDDYELKGRDYPIGYVRWTENRNMQAYIDLLKYNKLNLEPLITHTFDFEKAPDAYDMILQKEEHYCGVVLRYDVSGQISDVSSQRSVLRDVQEDKEPQAKERQRTTDLPTGRQDKGLKTTPRIGFIGAGSFAQNFLLPNIKKIKDMELVGIATSKGNNSKYAADKYGFDYATTDADQVINDENINTIFIATRHNTHAEFVSKGIEAGKNIFVEKPLALTEEDLYKITEAYKKPPPASPFSKGGDKEGVLMVGYNRRFAPFIKLLKEELNEQLPVSINYRINAGNIPADHWVQDPEIGGGRIIGEVCHFIDLAMYIAGSRISSVSAEVMVTKPQLYDSLVINLKFENGSIASISYFSNGNKKESKEFIEVFSVGKIIKIDDFKELEIISDEQKMRKKGKQDKGHKNEIESFLKSVKEGSSSPIPFDELYFSSLATFKVIESIQTKKVIRLIQ